MRDAKVSMDSARAAKARRRISWDSGSVGVGVPGSCAVAAAVGWEWRSWEGVPAPWSSVPNEVS